MESAKIEVSSSHFLWKIEVILDRQRAMTVNQALDFLKNHQPMPSDWDITNEEGATFAAILKYFEQHPDSRCLPLLIHSVSTETGLGMYEHISSVLMAHESGEVIPHLREGLKTGNDGVKFRCCWWATDVDAWELEEEIRPLLHYPDDDVREAAQNFLELKSELA
jgi:hypothetical protein